MQKTQEKQVWSLGQEDSPGGGNDNPFQYSYLGNPMDRGAWWVTVHGVAKSQTWLKRLSMAHTHNLTGLTHRTNHQFSSVAQSRLTLCDPMDYSTPGVPVHRQLLELTKLMSIKSVMPSNHLILCRPLLLPPSVFPSIRVFSSESVLRIRWPKYGVSASASVLEMNIQDIQGKE